MIGTLLFGFFFGLCNVHRPALSVYIHLAKQSAFECNARAQRVESEYPGWMFEIPETAVAVGQEGGNFACARWW